MVGEELVVCCSYFSVEHVRSHLRCEWFGPFNNAFHCVPVVHRSFMHLSAGAVVKGFFVSAPNRPDELRQMHLFFLRLYDGQCALGKDLFPIMMTEICWNIFWTSNFSLEQSSFVDIRLFALGSLWWSAASAWSRFLIFSETIRSLWTQSLACCQMASMLLMLIPLMITVFPNLPRFIIQHEAKKWTISR